MARLRSRTCAARRSIVIGSLASALPAVPDARTAATGASAPVDFKVHVEDTVLEGLRARIKSARMPVLAAGTGWKYGVDRDWFRRLLVYWADRYDWRSEEARINRLPQFTTDVSGRRLHFAHLRSPNPAARPLLLLHGWPYSFYSFSLTAPALSDDFHVVIPSLPGTLFSQPLADSPRGLRAASGVIDRLMREALGYSRYFVQGSDHGAVVADWLALDHPDAILGEQTNLVALRLKGAEYASGPAGVIDASAEERDFLRAEQATFKEQSAYFELHRTRPESIAYAMEDSPVGTAAYVLDKWQKWTDTRQRGLDEIYGPDRLLTELMLSIVSGSFSTSLWSYAGFMLEPFSVPGGRTIDVPFGFSGYPDPLNAPPPRRLVERSRTRIVQWEVNEAGGHFPFLENPDRFVTSFRRFADRV